MKHRTIWFERGIYYARRFIALLGCMTLSLSAFAQAVPPLINYQGRLTDSGGQPLPPGTYRVGFRLWDQAVLSPSQILVWSRSYPVTIIAGGIFNVILGAPGGSDLADAPAPVFADIATAFAAPNRYLGIALLSDGSGNTIADPKELVPRQQILSAPFALSSAQSQNVAQSVQDILQPPGAVTAYMGSVAPAGWLLCDGAIVRVEDYPRLFALIGTSSGSGTAEGTFRLPDLRGMFLRGMNGSRTDTNFWDPASALRTNAYTGGNVGNNIGSVQKDDLASHKHPFSMRTEAAGGGSFPNFLRNNGSVGSVNYETGLTGSDETRPRNVYVNFIIKF